MKIHKNKENYYSDNVCNNNMRENLATARRGTAKAKTTTTTTTTITTTKTKETVGRTSFSESDYLPIHAWGSSLTRMLLLKITFNLNRSI